MCHLPLSQLLLFPHLQYRPYHRAFPRLGDVITDMHHTTARSRGQAVALAPAVSHRPSCRTQVSTPQETRVPACVSQPLSAQQMHQVLGQGQQPALARGSEAGQGPRVADVQPDVEAKEVWE